MENIDIVVQKEPLAEEELIFLKEVGRLIKTIQQEDLTSELVRSLRRKMMLELGVTYTNIMWHDSNQPYGIPTSVIKLTPRGLEMIESSMTQGNAA